jgi:hypothetical protein
MSLRLTYGYDFQSFENRRSVSNARILRFFVDTNATISIFCHLLHTNISYINQLLTNKLFFFVITRIIFLG